MWAISVILDMFNFALLLDVTASSQVQQPPLSIHWTWCNASPLHALGKMGVNHITTNRCNRGYTL